MTIDDIKFLDSSEGRALLEEFANLSDKDLEQLPLRLHKKGLSHAAALVTLLRLRKRAGAKFARSSEMFFVPLGLEQATSERIARHIAERFGQGHLVADLTAGSGGNAIFLAQANRVVAIEPDEVTLACARLNARVYDAQDKIDFILGKVEDNLPEADAYFLDPARDRSGKTKTRSLLNSRPNLIELLPRLLKISNRICVKISPAFDYDELKLLPEMPEVEIVSEDNVSKVALLWFGRFKTCERRATCFNKDTTFTLIDQVDARAAVAGAPRDYLYDPDKAISKAHLIDELALEFGLEKLDWHSTLLTSSRLAEQAVAGCRVFRIIATLDFSWQSLIAKLGELSIDRANVIVKHFPLEPMEAYRRLRLKEGSDNFLIFATLKEKRFCFIAERLK